LGIGDWAQSPIPNPQSPIPNPHSPIFEIKIIIIMKEEKYLILYKLFILLNKYVKEYVCWSKQN
jgi:hypothetical protein